LGLGGVFGSSLHSVLGGTASSGGLDHRVEPSPLFSLSPQTNHKHNSNLSLNNIHRGNRLCVAGDSHSNGNNQTQGRADTAFQAQQAAPWISTGLTPQSLIFELERAFPITRIRISGFGYNSIKIQLARQVSGVSHVSIVGPSVSATANDKVTVIDFTPSIDANTYHAAMNTDAGAGSFSSTRGASGSRAGGSGSGSGSGSGIGYDSRAPVTGETNSSTKSKGNNNIRTGVSGGAGIAANHISIHLWNKNTNISNITTNSNYNSNLASDFFVVFEISVFYDDRSTGTSSSSSSSSGWNDTKKGMHK